MRGFVLLSGRSERRADWRENESAEAKSQKHLPEDCPIIAVAAGAQDANWTWLARFYRRRVNLGISSTNQVDKGDQPTYHGTVWLGHLA